MITSLIRAHLGYTSPHRAQVEDQSREVGELTTMKPTRRKQRSMPQTSRSWLLRIGRRSLDTGVMTATVGLLALTIVAVLFAMGSLGNRLSASPSRTASGIGSNSSPKAVASPNLNYTCGVTGKPACQAPASDWIPLTANTPDAVLQAARQSALFNENRSSGGDFASGVSRLETPILVRLYKHGNSYVPAAADYDVYAIPVDDASGNIVDVMLCNINASHTAIEVTMIAGVDPRPHGQLARTPEAQAVSEAHAQHGVSVRAGFTPHLIFIVMDATLIETGKITWKGGGLSAVDPLWVIPGSDGRDHIVGNDGKVYYPGELPTNVAPAAS